MAEVEVRLPGIEDRRVSLKKSAFSPSIYQGVPLEFFIPLIDNTYTYYYAKLRKVPDKLPVPKFYQAHDVLLSHYKPYDVVSKSVMQPKTAWQRLMQRYVSSPNFLQINAITSNSPELAALAGAEFLVNVYRYMVSRVESKTKGKVKDKDIARILPELFEGGSEKEIVEKLKEEKCCGGVESDIAAVLTSKVEMANAVKESSEMVRRMVVEIDESMKEAQAVVRDLSGSQGFSHEALSLISLLQNPEEFRRRVRLLKYVSLFARRFSQLLPTSLAHRQIVSEVGTIAGVERMTRESQLKDIIPSELALLATGDSLLRTEFTVRLLQKQVVVTRREAAFKPIVFVDKSGSMAEPIERDIPKISIATGLAFALYSKFGGEIYLFDTEVTGALSKKDVVDVLLRIEADGGTRIAEVLEKIAEIGRRDYVYIVISDGIDSVTESEVKVVQQLKSNIRFILVPPAWEMDWLRRNFRYVMARDVLSFEAAALASLS